MEQLVNDKHNPYIILGLNSGVMLMDLEKMRQFGWQDRLTNISKQYKSKVESPDQDVINIFFSYHPGIDPVRFPNNFCFR